MARKLQDMLAARSDESKQRIESMADDMLMEMNLQALREELEFTQAALAKSMGISQPSVVALEQRGKDLTLASLKRYVEAMGGKVTIDITLPSGKHISFSI